MNFLTEFAENIQELWNNLEKRAKIVILAGTILVFVILGYLIFIGNSTQYAPLYTDIVTEDASAIVDSLKEKNISYKISNGGSTISVPKDKIYQVRLDLASEGLPNQGVVGFEIFDNSQFGETDFERKVNYFRAIGGELSRSIRVMTGVEYAKVQITAPKDSLYLEEEVPASASVLLKLNPGYSMSESQVLSIANLVASSVQDLKPEGVTIIDTKGNLLSEVVSKTGGINQLGKSNLNIQENFEQGLEKDLKILLTKVLGPGNFSVNVNAKLNFDKREVESKTYSPVVGDEGIARSEETVSETNVVNSADAANAAGTESNIPQYQSEEDENKISEYENTSKVTNYEINEKIEKQVYSGGEVEKLSVSVMVNNIEDQELINKIKTSVQAAIGYNPERGDVVTVNNFAFDNSLEEEIAQKQQEVENAENKRMYIYGGLILLVLIIMVVLIIIIRRSQGTTSSQTRKSKKGNMIDYMSDEDISDELEVNLTPEEKKKKKLKEDLENVVSGQPEDAAKLLKNWLLED